MVVFTTISEGFPVSAFAAVRAASSAARSVLPSFTCSTCQPQAS
jgi:hypothetical protein